MACVSFLIPPFKTPLAYIFHQLLSASYVELLILIFHRGDTIQEMRVPDCQHALDKLIAATALNYDLTVVTRNAKDFKSTGARLLNPFIE